MCSVCSRTLIECNNYSGLCYLGLHRHNYMLYRHHRCYTHNYRVQRLNNPLVYMTVQDRTIESAPPMHASINNGPCRNKTTIPSWFITPIITLYFSSQCWLKFVTVCHMESIIIMCRSLLLRYQK